MKHLRPAELPWFVNLLGRDADHPRFRRLCEVYALKRVGPVDAPPGWYENAELGVSVYFEHGALDVVQFFSQPERGFGGAHTPTFLGIDYGMRRGDVRRRFGAPDEAIEARPTGVMGHSGVDRYFLRGLDVAFAYAVGSGRVESISFERPDRRK